MGQYFMYFSMDSSLPGGTVSDRLMQNPKLTYSSYDGLSTCYYAERTIPAFTSQLYWCAGPGKTSCTVNQSYSFYPIPQGRAVYLVFYDGGLLTVNSSGFSPTSAPTASPTRTILTTKAAAHEVVGTVLTGTSALGVAYGNGKFSLAAMQKSYSLSAYATGTYRIDKTQYAG
jgi:hypothetical protein